MDFQGGNLNNMGLDICHCILVEKNKNSVDHHTVEDFENNIEFLDHRREKIISEDSSEIIYYKDIGYIRKCSNIDVF